MLSIVLDVFGLRMGTFLILRSLGIYDLRIYDCYGVLVV